MSCTCEITDVGYNNGYRLTITGLKDFDDVFLNNATITYQIYDLDGTIVTGATGSFTSDGSGGNYTAIITSDIIDLLTNGQEYDIRAIGTAVGTGCDFEFSTRVQVSRRGST